MTTTLPNQDDLSVLLPANCDLSKETARDLQRLGFGPRMRLLTDAGIKLAAGIGVIVLAFWLFGPGYEMNKAQALIALLMDLFDLDLSNVLRFIGYITPVMFWLSCITGIIFLIIALGAMLRVVFGRVARKDPVATTKLFFECLTDTGLLDPDVVLAWQCLLKSAKADFAEGFDEFVRKWQEHISQRSSVTDTQAEATEKTASQNIQLEFKVKSVKQLSRSGGLAVVLTQLSAEGVDWQEVRLLARVSNRWYLADGSCYDETPPLLRPFTRGPNSG